MRLLLLTAVALTCAVAYGSVFTFRPASLLRTGIKTLATFCLAVISFLYDGPQLLTAALALGALGDGFLSLKNDTGFLPGLGSFLIGHICFVALFLGMGEGIEMFYAEPWRIVAGMAMVFFTLCMLRKLFPKLGPLTVPVILYILVIFCMGLATLSLPLVWPMALVMLGAFLFIASDAILAHELFLIEKDNPVLNLTAPVLWFCYWGGQALIAAGILL